MADAHTQFAAGRMAANHLVLEQPISPVAQLTRIARDLWADEGHALSSADVSAMLAATTRHFETCPSIDRAESGEFLQAAAHIIYGFYGYGDIVSQTVRLCGLLLVRDPEFEYPKKRLLLQEFGTLVDVIHITRMAMAAAYRLPNPKPMGHVMAILSKLLSHKLSVTNVPRTFHEALDYIVGTLEYFAFLPSEIKLSGEDFLPAVFLNELETRMGYYASLSSAPSRQ